MALTPKENQITPPPLLEPDPPVQRLDEVHTTVQTPLIVVAKMLQSAITAGVTPEVIGMLCEHYERADARSAQAAFNAALAAFQAACPVIPKSSRAEFASAKGGRVAYDFAELDQIRETIAPHLHSQGLSYRWVVRPGGSSAVPEAVVCEVRHAGGHVDAGSSFPVLVSTSSLLSPAQAYAAALTFAKRYALVNALGLVTGDASIEQALAAPKITDAQLSTVVALLDELPEKIRAEARAAMLIFARVDRPEDIPQDLFDRVVKGLKKRAEP